ncbi:hypothetical protein L226DRAFT_575618 [Lentinus tigrinus ALCF2SS1-7]|uniref:uncharacterized protein n=1 Tax=Lentinus tigrinus ALCF2SS1-7 TaxID=1328758 RepID=UPI0011663A5A|nr:hypothetical protein L226DRAFT_575618 [Lentinus tigrinus ALCF2SS1-7]
MPASHPDASTPPPTPPLPTRSLRILIDQLIRLLRCQGPILDHQHIARLVTEECLAIPAFRSILSTSAQASLICGILECIYDLASTHHHPSSSSVERAMSSAASDTWTSLHDQNLHICTISFPDGHRLFFPALHPSIPPLRIVHIHVADDVEDSARIQEDYVDIDDDDDMPPLIDP